MRHSRFVNPACLDKQMGRLAAKLFLTGKFLPNYVEAVFASRRLPPKAAVTIETGSSLFGYKERRP